MVIEAVLVQQSRRDPLYGSQDLLTIGYLSSTYSGIIGCIIAAVMYENQIHPKYTFLGFGIYGFILGIAALFLNKEAEKEFFDEEELAPTEFSSELRAGQTPSEAARIRRRIEREKPSRENEDVKTSCSRNLRLVWMAICFPEVYRLIIYFVVDGLTNPTFQDFFFFFVLDVIGISRFMFVMIFLCGYVCGLFGVLVYQSFLKGLEVRTLLLFSVIANVIVTFL